MMQKALHKILFDLLINRLAWLIFKVFCKGEIKNIDSLKKLDNKPYIVAFNHTSHFDWFFIFPLFHLILKRKISFIAKKELFETFFWKSIMEYAGSIRLDREKINTRVLRALQNAVRENKVIGIFPEGTRTLDGNLLKGKEGVVRIARFLNIPIVPVGLNGFFESLPKSKLLPRRCKCCINIGEPIHFESEESSLSTGNQIELIMKEIAKLCNLEYPYSHKESP